MIENDLFTGMQFGDRFLTRDGRHAVLANRYGHPTELLIFFVEGWGLQEVGLDGRVRSGSVNSLDIVQRCLPLSWQPCPPGLVYFQAKVDLFKSAHQNIGSDAFMREYLSGCLAVAEQQLSNVKEG